MRYFLIVLFSFANVFGSLDLVERYPELLWLADDAVMITQEGIASDSMSDSENLFGKRYIEFDRTLMGLRCLEWFIAGTQEAYEQLSSGQNEEVKLS